LYNEAGFVEAVYIMRNNLLKIIGGLAPIILLGSILWAGAAKITIKGSDTLVRLGRAWANIYTNDYPEVHIHVSGGGSGRGINALMEGNTDICESSRDLTDEEYAEAEQRGINPVRIPVALDGIVIFVHPANPVENFTFDQLRAIFTGEIINWKDLGGEFTPIKLYGRENVSGTYAYFKHNVLRQQDYSDQILSLPTTAAVVNAVAKDENGIGYGGVTWVENVKYVAVSRDESTPAVQPTANNIAEGVYPISRELFWFFNGTPGGELRNLVNWVLSEEGQKIAKQLNYVPLSLEEAKRQRID
jgi:phosphate transport system substrate-binding protein